MSRRTTRALGAATLLLAAGAAGCASSQAGAAGAVAAAEASPQQAGQQAAARRDSRNTLTAVDLMGSGTTNLYDAISKLRPEFLRQRGTQTITKANMPVSSRGGGATFPAERDASTGEALPIAGQPIVVYENDIKLAGVEDLRRIDTKVVLEVRYMAGPQAGVRYGTNHSGGVIFVKTQ